jgi:hypothetical protein
MCFDNIRFWQIFATFFPHTYLAKIFVLPKVFFSRKRVTQKQMRAAGLNLFAVLAKIFRAKKKNFANIDIFLRFSKEFNISRKRKFRPNIRNFAFSRKLNNAFPFNLYSRHVLTSDKLKDGKNTRKVLANKCFF